jgi:hypothetical protein
MNAIAQAAYRPASPTARWSQAPPSAQGAKPATLTIVNPRMPHSSDDALGIELEPAHG